jgi:hemoglobin
VAFQSYIEWVSQAPGSKPQKSLSPEVSPYELLGGTEPVLALAKAFYDVMERDEPALTALHPRAPHGGVRQDVRDRFGLFLVGWLGGPQDYMALHGHPRLRMRHGHVPVDVPMRDAWLRSMKTALAECGVQGELRAYLEQRFGEVADFLRNQP